MRPGIARIDQFGLLETGLRNIRCRIDGRNATFDLVPERLVSVATDVHNVDHPALQKLTDGASLVVEGTLALRLEFHNVLAMAADGDADVDLHGALHADWLDAPRLDGVATYYPLLEITPSAWKALLPDWRGRDNPQIRHVRMISAECSFDVLGELASGAWIANARGA